MRHSLSAGKDWLVAMVLLTSNGRIVPRKYLRASAHTPGVAALAGYAPMGDAKVVPHRTSLRWHRNGENARNTPPPTRFDEHLVHQEAGSLRGLAGRSNREHNGHIHLGAGIPQHHHPQGRHVGL